MAQSNLVKIVGGVVVGAVAAGAAIGAFFEVKFRSDIESGTILSLDPKTNTCVVSGKEIEVRVRRKARVVWKIRNYCTDGEQTVVVGNFRSEESGHAADCSNPTENSSAYPFTQTAPADRTKTVSRGVKNPDDSITPGTAKLKLKVQDQADYKTYYYDICVGAHKNEPRLIVER